MTIITKRFFTVLIAAIALLIVGLLIEELLSIRSGSLFGHTQTGHVVGWIGLAVILTVFVYSIKKRFGRKTGWPKAWFLVHQVAGIVGPIDNIDPRRASLPCLSSGANLNRHGDRRGKWPGRRGGSPKSLGFTQKYEKGTP